MAWRPRHVTSSAPSSTNHGPSSVSPEPPLTDTTSEAVSCGSDELQRVHIKHGAVPGGTTNLFDFGLCLNHFTSRFSVKSSRECAAVRVPAQPEGRCRVSGS